MARNSQSQALKEAVLAPGMNPFNGAPAPPKQPESSDNVIKISHPDGSITIDFDPKPTPKAEQNKNDFYRNLALDMDVGRLGEIASDLLEGIQRDEDSRKDWLETRARGISLLGTVLKNPKTDLGNGAIEGMSSIDHPIILEATIAFQATARAELLPAAGPVKVRNDSPTPPDVNQQTSARQQLASSLADLDKLSQALEKDMNHYLTVTATEYVPDTDRMLFHVGFGGDGFKKIYNCPLRRRPVSESVDAKDLIVSDAATDLKSCGRITHRIRMRPSVLKRMQIIGAYRDVQIAEPPPPKQTEVDRKLQETSGIKNVLQRPKDRDYELYETYCEIDINEYAPKKFKNKGLPLPYRVTIERDSRQILDIRRNWKEEDTECLPKQFFVQFPFIRGLGFYGLGYIHTLGNIAMTLTAGWRETIDAGMYASFPGFLFDSALSRQLTNQFRVPPGGGVPIQVGPNKKIQDSIMPIPYKEVGGNFVQFLTHVEDVGRRIAAAGNMNVGEGKQDAPVGTTLALIEQATKVIDSAHKRLHAAQAEEFGLLKERFQEDPEAFWRFNKTPAHQWQKEQFLKALNDCYLVPVADPNNPTSLHRIAKATAIKELQKASPELYDATAVDMRIMQVVGIDPHGLFKSHPTPQPPDPRMEAIKEKAAASERQAKIQYSDSQMRHTTEEMKIMDKERDRRSRERLEAMRIELERIQMFTEGIEKDQTAYADAKAKEQEIYEMYAKEAMKEHIERMKESRNQDRADRQQLVDTQEDRVKHRLELITDREKHREKLENDKEIAKIKAAAKPKPKTAKKARGGGVDGEDRGPLDPDRKPLKEAVEDDGEGDDDDDKR